MRGPAARTRINGVLFRLIISKPHVARASFLPSLDVSLSFRLRRPHLSHPLYVLANYVFCLHLLQVTLRLGYMPALFLRMTTLLFSNRTLKHTIHCNVLLVILYGGEKALIITNIMIILFHTFGRTDCYFIASCTNTII